MITFVQRFLLIAITAFSFVAAHNVAASLHLSIEQAEAHNPMTLSFEDESADAAAFAEALNVGPPALPSNIILGSGNMTLSGGLGETVTLNLRDFVLGGNSTLTLEGTATTAFVINVNRRFSLSGNSAIVLADGVQVTNVFFNITGKGTASLTGNSVLRGIVNAPGRTVKLKQHSTIYGTVVARRLLVGPNARMIPPPVVSP